MGRARVFAVCQRILLTVFVLVISPYSEWCREKKCGSRQLEEYLVF